RAAGRLRKSGRVWRRGRTCTAKLDGRAGVYGQDQRVLMSVRKKHMSAQPAAMHFPTEGDEKMRASKLITISTIAVLMGGTSFAIGQGSADSLQRGSSPKAGSAINQGGARGSETGGSNPRAAEIPMRRSEASGQRGSNLQGSRDLQRGQGQAMTAERGRASA